ncbi:MAG: segregation/condensation protein A [Thermodesulfobacteriota bacterium]|nr:segregation/condensation protein A [Thermodesulfobacteriota bacterium]
MPYNIKLEVFEGPLDLLFHLIKKNEMDICDIPIAEITQQYFEYLDLMKTLNLDIAGEFVVMAATLMHIKSRMLLPPADDEEEDEGDPRAELVRRLIEYQKFKDVANRLKYYEILDRDVFIRGANNEFIEEEKDLHNITVFELIEAFKRIHREKPPQDFLYVAVERMSINDRIIEIIERMEDVTSMAFESLFLRHSDKSDMILTFLALLELTRLMIVRIVQATPFGTIRIFPIHSRVSEEMNKQNG